MRKKKVPPECKRHLENRELFSLLALFEREGWDARRLLGEKFRTNRYKVQSVNEPWERAENPNFLRGYTKPTKKKPFLFLTTTRDGFYRFTPDKVIGRWQYHRQPQGGLAWGWKEVYRPLWLSHLSFPIGYILQTFVEPTTVTVEAVASEPLQFGLFSE